jgi:hypothetical protein
MTRVFSQDEGSGTMSRMKIGLAPLLVLVVAMTATASVHAAPKSDPSVLNGVYRVTWSEREAIAAGAPYRSAHADFGFAHGERVVITITLREGRFSLRDTSRRPTCKGRYTVTGKSVSIRERPPECRGDIRARWSLQARLLRLRVNQATDPGDKVVFGEKPWRKVG